MKPYLAVAVHEDEFLNALAGFNLARIQISLRIHGDGVDPMEIAGHSAIVSDRSDELACHAVVNPNLVVGAVGDQHVLSHRVMRKSEVVSSAAHAVDSRAGTTAFHAARRSRGMHEEAGNELPLLGKHLNPIVA